MILHDLPQEMTSSPAVYNSNLPSMSRADKPVLLRDRMSLSLFTLCSSSFSQFSAHSRQTKSVYINKQREEVIVAVLSQGQHQFTGQLKVQTHRQFSTFHEQLT